MDVVRLFVLQSVCSMLFNLTRALPTHSVDTKVSPSEAKEANEIVACHAITGPYVLVRRITKLRIIFLFRAEISAPKPSKRFVELSIDDAIL
jgi:hypothetical protein